MNTALGGERLCLVLKLVTLFSLFILYGGCAGSVSQGVPKARQSPQELAAEDFMVSAAHPLAVEAGLDVMRAGGNAIDAAVAVQAMLNVVEPAESGIGGGAFLLYRDGKTGAMRVFDGREIAPAAAKPDRFLWFGGFARPLYLTVPTGQAIGVPGLVKMLHSAHRELGTRPWQSLFKPAIDVAEQGVPMPPRLQRQLDRDLSLRLFADIRRSLISGYRETPPRVINPALAETFRILAAEGPEGFYQGPIAESIVAAAHRRRPWASDLTLDDLRNYEPVERESLCAEYRQWTVCGLPPPSSGGITVMQILGMLEGFDLSALGPGSPEAIHLLAEASRLAFADRFFYIGDPAFVDIPTDMLLSKRYLRSRAGLIDPTKAVTTVKPGSREDPFLEKAPEPEVKETAGTSHFNIVDREGNIVAMTTSIEAPFGSRIMTRGFLLNNTLTDFSEYPRLNGQELPNAVAPGKRPRSSMAPVIVFDSQGDVRLVVGSRGGSRIIGYVVKMLIGVLDWELSAQAAAGLPNVVHRNEDVGIELEAGTAVAEHAEVLREMGHRVEVLPLESGIHAIERVNGRWRGAADPRMDGIARGQ